MTTRLRCASPRVPTVSSANECGRCVRAACDFRSITPGDVPDRRTGDIRVSAARNVEFGDRATIYAAGVNGMAPTGLFSFADRGGNVSIAAGESVVGTETLQSVGDWQRRQGALENIDPGCPVVDQFRPVRLERGHVRRGGDISIVAGADVTDFTAAAADSGAEIVRNSVVTQFGGGSMSVLAGGNIDSNMLYVARGDMNLRADGALGAAARASVTRRWEACSCWAMRRRRSPPGAISISRASSSRPRPTVARPTSLPIPVARRSMLAADGGDVVLSPTMGRLERLINGAGDGGFRHLFVLPASVSLMSLARDVRLEGAAVSLFPSNEGQLDIFAAQRFHCGRGRDGDHGGYRRCRVANAGAGGTRHHRTAVGSMFLTTGSAKTARHINDAVPVMITAGRDILDHNISLPKAVRTDGGS